MSMSSSPAKSEISEPNWALYDSVQRPVATIDWVLENVRNRVPDEVLGPVFWKIVRERWSTFDRLEHNMFEAAFFRFKSYWEPQPEILRLPERFVVWRGGDRYSVRKGLSWTLRRSVAEDFARGHRFLFNKYPTLLTAVVDRSEVVQFDNSRNEHEVVLFKRLYERAQRVVPFSVKTWDYVADTEERRQY